MKRILALILVMSSFAVFSGTSSASIKPGTSCSPKGKISIFAGVKYTCVLSGKKLVWNKGVKAPSSTTTSPASTTTFAAPALSALASALPCQLPYSGPLDNTQRTGFPHDSASLPNSGTINALMVFEDFSDVSGTDNIQSVAKTIQTNISSYFSSVSYGKVNFKFTTYPSWIHVNATSGSFGMKNPGVGDQMGLAKAEQSSAAKVIDFSPYTIMYVVLPSTADLIHDSLPFPLAAINARWPETNAQIPGNPLSFLVSLSNLPSDSWATPLHETGHIFGFVHPFGNNIWPVWDVMYIGGQVDPAFSAPGLLGWERWLVNWVTDSQVACIDQSSSGSSTYNYLLTPIELNSNSVKIAVIKLTSHTAIVVESRRSIGEDVFPTSYEGALVYSIDTSKNGDVNSLSPSINILGQSIYAGHTELVGTIRAGESITYQGQTVKVLANTSVGDYVQITTGTVTG